MHIRHALFAAAVLVAATAHAAPPLRPARFAAPPVIDGVLDEEAWRTAPSVTGFVTWLPDYGVTMADQTVAYYAYDAENMYFAFRAFDREPGRIKASMAARDNIRPDDWICVNLDSFDDQQGLYAFYVNPLGIQADSRFATGREDYGFDAVWYSAGRIDDRGYTVEMRIPFKSLRYTGRDPVRMGIIFERSITRRNEDGTVPAMDPKSGMNFLIQMQPIEFTGIRHYTLLEVLPDATYSRQDARVGPSLARAASGGDVGITAKYGITAQLVADGTYNPDFSQVEADAGQIDVNLRHPLFFAEKRPFFLEGNDVFNLAGPSQNGVLQSIVHTRTIVNPRAGAKVSGKLARADTLAALYAADELPQSEAETSGVNYAHVAVLRYKRSLRQDSYLGGFYVGREQGHSFNRVAGMDGTLRLSSSASLGFHAFGSSTANGGGTDAGAPSGGTTGGATTGGHAIGGDYSRETRRLTLYLAGLDVSTGFTASSGYLTRNGVTELIAAGAYRFYPKPRWLRRLQFGAAAQETRDAFSSIWETYHEANTSLMFAGATTASVLCHSSSEVYLGVELPTSGCVVQATSQPRKQLRVQVSASSGRAIYYSSEPFGGRSSRGSIALVYQPSEQWSDSLSVTYANFDRPGGGRLYDYAILRNKIAFQVNRYLFFRGIVEYNSYRRQMITDFLGSFTYIPGTVLHLGYGSLYEKTRWDGAAYVPDSTLLETRRGVFFKASYLWRL